MENDITQINTGMLAEQFVGQEIIAYGPYYEPAKLFFCKKIKKEVRPRLTIS